MKNNISAIVFDMDGTLASLYEVENWLPKLRAFDPSPYAEAKPMVDFHQLNTILDWLKYFGVKIIITSWLSKNSTTEYDKAVRQAKKDWIQKYNIPVDEIHIIKYGTTKANSTRKYEGEQILIDDDDKVRKGWTLGRAVNPTTENIYKILADIVVSLFEQEVTR